jgi:CheY-like chemotaxis protein
VKKTVFHILLVEDSPSDAFLTTQALMQTERPVEVHTVSDGVEALAFLKQAPPFSEAERPDLILLDLNMPRKDGREVLSEIKVDSDFKCIPVIVFTSSSADQDLHIAYNLHANCYVVKPADFKRFKETVKSIEDFWFNTVAFPDSDPVSAAASTERQESRVIKVPE